MFPDWAADDPLDNLLGVWFGAYGTSAQGVSLEKLPVQALAPNGADESLRMAFARGPERGS